MRAISHFHSIFIALLLVGFFFVILGVIPASAGTTTIEVQLRGSSSISPADLACKLNAPCPPSVTSTTLGATISKFLLRIVCLRDGQPLPGCTITLTPTGEFGTGGHPHDGTRLAGCFLKQGEPQSLCLQPIGPGRSLVITRAITDVTGPGGFFDPDYIVPEPSGLVNVDQTGTNPEGQPLPPIRFSFDIKIADTLVALPASGDGFVMAPGTTHPQNNFALSSVRDALTNIPVKFRSELLKQGVPLNQVPTLTYTSLNLPLGGLFDLNNNWRPEHASHRFGTDADLRIRNVPKRFRKHLAKVIRDNFDFPARGERPDDPLATHWHLRAR